MRACAIWRTVVCARLCFPLLLVSLLFPAVTFASSYTLYIKSGSWTVNGSGGTTLPVWGFTDATSGGPIIPAPVIESHENETVTVTVYNQHTLSCEDRKSTRLNSSHT